MLSRKRNEGIVITVPPSDVARVIEVVIVEIRGDKVRAGYEADKDIVIHRQEVFNAIERNGSNVDRK